MVQAGYLKGGEQAGVDIALNVVRRHGTTSNDVYCCLLFRMYMTTLHAVLRINMGYALHVRNNKPAHMSYDKRHLC